AAGHDRPLDDLAMALRRLKMSADAAVLGVRAARRVMGGGLRDAIAVVGVIVAVRGMHLLESRGVDAQRLRLADDRPLGGGLLAWRETLGLVEARHRVAHVRGIVNRKFPFRRDSEGAVIEIVALLGIQCARVDWTDRHALGFLQLGVVRSGAYA